MIQSMEQNKIIFQRIHKSTPSTNYRSIKYKILPSASPLLEATSFNRSQSVVKNKTQRQPWRKPSSFSHKGHSITSYEAEVPEQSPFRDYKGRESYLSTWDQMLASSQKQPSKLPCKIQPLRVHLPSIIEFQPSKFTSLDPLFLPFEDIQRGINELREGLPAPKEEMAQMHHEMINFKGKIIEDLENTERIGLREIRRLKNMLKAGNVEYQEFQMRFRRNCLVLKQQDEAFKADFEQTKPRLDVLQEQLFSCQPFNLTRNEQLDEQFPQDYF